ncbi:hypothetical protein ACJIZ3_005418 [Penstemon smallii]|uniref:Uncharacterized protein n=1 Tax=Penstemon smallii TaxID=265156 RepID=A0ABD3S4V3_9LAMI
MMAPPPRFHLRRHSSADVVELIQKFLLPLTIFIYTGLSHSIVENLPGFPAKLPFSLETGYIGVGPNEEVQLFYYFFESEGNPQDDPLLLWLTGGPGCSGLSPILYEIGPITIDYANSNGSLPALKLHEYSWTKVANIIFIDQPAGTGFSYAKTREAYYSNDTTSATLTYDFLRKWLINHPKYLKNPLYIGGDSYSGIILPLVVDHVYGELENEPLLNMKGYILGNPFTDTYSDVNERVQYAHRMGLLSNGLYKLAKQMCHGNYVNVDVENVLCQNVLERVNQCLNKVRASHILEPWCGDRIWNGEGYMPLEHLLSQENIQTNFLQSIATLTKSWCRLDNLLFSISWANDKSVQKALNVREGTKTDWIRCNTSIANSTTKSDGTTIYVKNVPSTMKYHTNFTHKSCRVLIYSGDHDLLVPHTSTENWIDSLKLPIQSDWRPWFVEGQIAGYTMRYVKGAYELTYATVKGAGHTAPEFNPKQCLPMVRSWFNEKTL